MLTADDLWRIAYSHGDLRLSIGGGHSTLRYVTVAGVRYNVEDPEDLHRLKVLAG